MSRGYSRSGGGLTIILAIIGTLIVVVVGIFLYSKFSGGSVFGGGATPSPTPMLTTPEPTATAVPSPTLVAIVTPEPTIEPSASVDILGGDSSPTIAPVTAAPNFQTVTVAVAKLSVRSGAGSSYSKVGSVTYNQTYEVFAESSKWVQIRVNNTYGWIYTGTDSSGDLCAVRGSTAVPSMPVHEDPTWLKSVTLSGKVLTVKFTKGVYGNSEHTTGLDVNDFTVKEGSASVGVTVTHTAGSDTATLTIGGSTSGGKITVSIAGTTVYDSTGASSPSGSVTTGETSSDSTSPTTSISYDNLNTVTITFSDNDTTLAMDATKISLSNTSGPGPVSYSVSGTTGTTITLTLTFDGGSNTSGTYAFTITVGAGCAKDDAGNSNSSAIKDCSRTI